MLLKSIFIFYLAVNLSHADTEKFDCYTGEPVTSDRLAEYEKLGVVDKCVIDIEPCDENEWRRADGSCNNLKHSAKGTFTVPMERILPSDFYNGSYSRKSISGKDLTLPRVVRTTLLKQGISKHRVLTHLAPGLMLYMFLDIASVHDIFQFLFVKTDCCQKEHMNDYACTPNIIPEDDPVHRFSGIRCMNLTRPVSFQDLKCTEDPVPSPIQRATACFDLSNIYNFNNEGFEVIRSFSDGLLEVEEEDGKIWPPNGPASGCPYNQGKETRCFKNYLNSFIPVNLFTIWYMRHHNHIAKNLAAVNPCWDDETLFQNARDINIAYSQQILLYELLPILIGRRTLEDAGVIANHCGFRNIYDEDLYPTVYLEYAYLLRWFHTIQDDTVKMTDTEGNHLYDFPTFNVTLRTGWMALDNRMTYLTQDSFRSISRNTDSSIAYDIGERGLPGAQCAVDVVTSDLHKGRLFGLPPYVDYVYKFTGINITCFEDLAQVIKPTQIEPLMMAYEHVEDIDTMAGLWCENIIEDGKIPSTLANIIITMFYKAVRSDRHFYELEFRPHAFTLAQLMEIRKATVAGLICSVGDEVTEIQKRAFIKPSHKNPLISCSEIPQIDYSVWADPSCSLEDC